MKTKLRPRYYCDYCKKAGGSSGHMKRHEKGCTLNPSRHCGVCDMLEKGQSRLPELIALLPDKEQFRNLNHPAEWGIFYRDEELTAALNKALPVIREACGDCPACIMAALRQRGIPVPLATDYNWTNEMKDIWTNINDANAESSSWHS